MSDEQAEQTEQIAPQEEQTGPRQEQTEPREKRAPRPSNEITVMVDRLAVIWEELEKSKFICVNGRSKTDIKEFVTILNKAAEYQENRSLINTINALSYGNQRNFNDYLFNNKIVFWCLLTNFNAISTNLKRHRMFYIHFDRQEKSFTLKINEEMSTNYNPFAPKTNTLGQKGKQIESEGKQNVRTGRQSERKNMQNKTAEFGAPRFVGFDEDKSNADKSNTFRPARSSRPRKFEENGKYVDGLNINNFKQEEKKFTSGIKPQTFDSQKTESSMPAPAVKTKPLAQPAKGNNVAKSASSLIATNDPGVLTLVVQQALNANNKSAPIKPVLHKSWADETDD